MGRGRAGGDVPKKYTNSRVLTGSKTLCRPSTTQQRSTWTQLPSLTLRKTSPLGLSSAKTTRSMRQLPARGETAAIELSDNNNVSIIESKTLDDTDAHGMQEQRRRTRSAGDRVATCSRPPAIGPTAEATPAGATGLGPIAADGSTVGGPGGK
jgi:hypothetical protein